MIYEEPLAHDPGAVCLLFRAFNRWLAEDWTFNVDDRIFAAPYITLAAPAWAAEELAWALDQGARTVVMRPAAPVTATLIGSFMGMESDWPSSKPRTRTGCQTLLVKFSTIHGVNRHKKRLFSPT